MKILDCRYLQKESFEECFPYWGLCRHWMKQWFDLKVNEDWSHPIHIPSECNYWKFQEFQKISLPMNQAYHWHTDQTLPPHCYATLFFRDTAKGYIETPDDVVVIENYQLYLDQQFRITNEDNHPIEFYVGTILLDPIADPIDYPTIPRQIEYLQSHQSVYKNLPKRYILLTHFESLCPEARQIYWNLQQMGQCHMVSLQYHIVTRRQIRKFILQQEDKYLDDFEIQYYHRDVPEKWKTGDVVLGLGFVGYWNEENTKR